MLSDVKIALRLSNNAFDGEVIDLIESARHDLILSGILSTKVNDDTDALIKRAIIFYCKSHFGWDNQEADRLEMAYQNIKKHLALSTEYTVEVV